MSKMLLSPYLRRGWQVISRRRGVYGLSDFRRDAFGGTTAGVLLLPVTVGFGIISGLGPVAGIYGAVAVCLFAAVFGGTRGMVAGPNMFASITMGLIVAGYTNNIAEALTAAMLVGLLQIAFGALRFGRYISYIPYSLLSGFFTAAGILLIATQALTALGSSPTGGGVIGNFRAWPTAAANANLDALFIAVIAGTAMALWRGRLLRLAPAQFVALILGTLAGILWFGEAPVIGVVSFGLPNLQLPVLSSGLILRVVEPVFMMAVLISVPTLLTALRLDSVTGTQHKPNRELISHGLGNIAAGLIGGSPGGVSSGALINVYSGGRYPMSAIIAALVLLLAVIALRDIVALIPLAVLSAILINIGWSIVDWRLIFRLHVIPREYAGAMIVTVLLAVFVGFIEAILVGLVISALIGPRRLEEREISQLISLPLLDRMVRGENNSDSEADPFATSSGLVSFPDRVSVASARELTRIVSQDTEGKRIMVFDFSRTVYVDDTAVSAIERLVNSAQTQRSQRFVIVGLRGDVARTFNSMRALSTVPKDRFAADIEEAKGIIGPMLSAD